MKPPTFAFRTLVALAICGTAQATPKYEIHELPTPPRGNSSELVAVNDAGHAVVRWRYLSESQEGDGYFFWSPERGYVTIEAPRGVRVVTATAIDDHDRVVGADRDGNGFVWGADGSWRRFPAPPGMQLLPRAINDRGVIVGQAYTYTASSSFYVTRKMTGPVVDPSGDDTSAADVNAFGVALIEEYSSWGSGYPTARYLFDHGARTPVSVAPPLQFGAWIDDAREVATTAFEADGSWSAGIWSEPLGFTSFGLPYSYAVGVTRQGVVALNAAGGAYLWTREEGARKLIHFIARGQPPVNDVAIRVVSGGGVLGADHFRGLVILTPVRPDGDDDR